MKLFDWSEQREAIRYAAAGGQALHVHRFGVSESSPAVFRVAARGRKHIAHLFDWNTERLAATTRALGVVRLHIDRADEAGQHSDLVGRPLEAALKLCGGRETAGRLWMTMHGRRPFVVPIESPVARWNWIGRWPTRIERRFNRPYVRGVAWFRERVGAADDRAKLPDQLFDLLVLAFSPDFMPMVDDRGIAGIMFKSGAWQRVEQVFEQHATREQVDALLGQWRWPRFEINTAEAFAQRFEGRFLRPVNEQELRMAFGRLAS